MAALTASGDDAIKTPTPTAYFIASLSTGERPGEMDALRWPQVDFKNRTITVDRAIKRADGGRPLGIGPTKTGNRRDVEMTDVLAVALRHHRKQQAERRRVAGPYWTVDPRWADLVLPPPHRRSSEVPHRRTRLVGGQVGFTHDRAGCARSPRRAA